MEARFGAFSFNDTTRELRCGGRPVRLSPKAFDLLAVLVSRQPDAVSKDELHATLWPGTFVSDGSLAVLVAEIRRALGDSAQQPAFIRTVNRFGYAFLSDAGLGRTAPDTALCYLASGKQRSRLKPGENIIGRDPDADICLDAVGVSRRHACIVLGDDGPTLNDLGSKNGTFADGIRITAPTRLADRTELRFGAIRAVFSRVPAAPPTQTIDHRAADEGSRRD